MNDLVARKQALPLGFDYNAYIKYNPDVAYSWDHDLATHWILYGQSEGRKYKEDISPYQTNSDIPPVPGSGGSNPYPPETDTGTTIVEPVQETGGSNTGLLIAAAAVAAVVIAKRRRTRTNSR